MYKKTINYTDFNGNDRKEDFYFNLSKAEILKMNFEQNGGLANMIDRIINTQDVKALMSIFDDIVTRSYGVKSDDGRRFIKTDELTEAFKQTEAYSELFVELIGTDGAAAEFINGIIPQKVREELAKQEAAKAEKTE